MYIPSLKLIFQIMLKKSPENADGRTDGRTDERTDGHCHGIIRPKNMFFEDCGQWVSSCWKSATLFLFLMHLYSSTSDAQPGNAYR